jgi:hypothetical protein
MPPTNALEIQSFLGLAGYYPPRPLPLPLLYWPPPPPPLPVTSAHRHQWCRLHFTVARSPPFPSAPIKGAPDMPHLIAPHTTLLSSSLTPELAPTTHHQSPPLCRRSISGEGHPRHRHVPLSLLHPSRQPPASHSTCMPRFGGNAATLLAAPPRSTVDRATGMVHRPWTESPIIQYKNNLVYSKEKTIFTKRPCFCLKSSRSPIKFQTAPLEFKSISRYNPSHCPKSQIGP